jgi:hypothetical protein
MDAERRAGNGCTHYGLGHIGLHPVELGGRLIHLALEVEAVLLATVEFIGGDGTGLCELAAAGKFSTLNLKTSTQTRNPRSQQLTIG